MVHVSALSRCVNLHTLDLSKCENVEDVSALSVCRKLHTLRLRFIELKDVSVLSGCVVWMCGGVCWTVRRVCPSVYAHAGYRKRRRLLLAAGADSQAQSARGRTALDLALQV